MRSDYSSQSEYLPIVNGIVYANGVVQRYTIQTDRNGRRLEIHPSPSDDQNKTVETKAYINDALEWSDRNVEFFIGEGSYGGDGFILAECVSTNKMLWLISFDNANPFVKLSRYDTLLLAENNCGEEWAVAMHDMENVSLSIVKQSVYW